MLVGHAMVADVPPRPIPPWAQELAQQLLDAVVSFTVSAPLRPGPPRGSAEPPPGLAAGKRLQQRRPATDYDRAYAEVADQIDDLVRHLEQILRAPPDEVPGRVPVRARD